MSLNIKSLSLCAPSTATAIREQIIVQPPIETPDRFDPSERIKWRSPPPCANFAKNLFPQIAMDKFWKDFTTKKPGKTFNILPGHVRAKRAAIKASIDAETPKNAVTSYEQAAAACKAEIDSIVGNCLRLNQKYKDPDFDIERDLALWLRCGWPQDCLVPLGKQEKGLLPRSVKRIEDIFEDPQFDVGGISVHDVMQGKVGDCWLISAICALSNSKDLLYKICVARDEQVGAYGFVFHRDGEWKHCIVDDKLYLAQENFRESDQQRQDWGRITMTDAEEEWKKVMQTGSKALYFAKCKNQNATWLPLLEKAYAKAHGDYGSIVGGWSGEAVEELTGGVTSELFTSDILDKDHFWRNELMKVNQSFLFNLQQMGGLRDEEKGIVRGHAYSIMEVAELDDVRLVKISAEIPWSVQYLDTSFRITIPKATQVVIVLCQLDDRYFLGLVGQYEYELQFQVHKEGGGYIADNKPAHFQRRSATAELDLEEGQYTVKVKIMATRYESKATPEEIVARYCKIRFEKLQAVGRNYDLAHAKGGLKESGLEREERLRKQRREKRKVKAREAFELHRLYKKKEKLRQLRIKAKKEKKGDSNDDHSKDNLAIQISMSGKNMYTTTNAPQNETKDIVSDVTGNTKQFKVTVETPNTNSKPVTELKTATDTHPPRELTLDDISDDGLSWSSDIDAPPNSDSDDLDESDSDDADAPPPPPPKSEPNKDSGKEAAEKDKAEKDAWRKGPWNAVCVFGLRVYAKEAQAEIAVIRKSDEGKAVQIKSDDWRAAAGG
ncbi:MAG: hypothetical protein Q9168_005661 [Polycauliona sp. 1 TL-2023]